MLAVIDMDEQKEEEQRKVEHVKQSFSDLGAVENDKPESESVLLRIAQTRNPEVDWERQVASESAYKPWNDFDEEKQEVVGSFGEREARSAAIRAKLEKARNRLSMVRYAPTVSAEPH